MKLLMANIISYMRKKNKKLYPGTYGDAWASFFYLTAKHAFMPFVYRSGYS